MFRQLFKPKWQRQQPEQRLQALEQLSHSNSKDADIIAALCRDPHATVQQAAIKRCADLNLLRSLAEEAPATAATVAEQLAKLLSSFNTLTKEDVLSAIKVEQNPQVLATVVIKQTDDEARNMAFKRLGYLAADDALLRIAREARDADTRYAAAEQLTAPASWRTLQQHSRDKRVAQLARQQWRAHQALQQQLDEAKAARNAILAELEQHQRRPVDNLYEARLNQWQQQWQENSDGVDEDESSLLACYVAACTQQLQNHAAEQAAAEAQAAALAAQQKTITEYQATLARFQQPQWENEIGHLGAAFTLQERYWASLIETTPAEPQQAQKFAELKQRWQTLQQFINHYQEALQQAGDGTSEQTQALFAELAKQWPNNLSIPASFAAQLPAPAAPAEPVQKPSANPTRDPLFHRLRSALRQRNLRQANRLWQRLENELAEKPDEQRKERYAPLQEQLQELRDWHNFAAEPKKVELCEAMEALAAQTMDAEEKASAIQALHQQWRALMSSHQDADQALWECFKNASDAAYEPCKEHFAQLDELRQKNLKERQALCEQLESLVGKIATEGNTDWAALFEIRRQAPQAYRAFEPIRYTEAKPTDERFSKLLRQLDAALNEASKAHRPAHEEVLQQLAAEHEKPAYPEQLETLKQLQQAWRGLPWLHPREYRQLNKQFRQQADALFQQLQQQRQDARAQHSHNKQQLEAALTAFADAMPDLAPTALREHMEQLTALPCPPREKQLNQRRQQLIKQAAQRLAIAPLLKQQAALQQRIAALATQPESNDEVHTLVIAAEAITGAESPEADKQRRLQWQLEQLPNAMTQGRIEPLKQLNALFEEHSNLLTKGVTSEQQQRLLAAINHLHLQ